MEPELEWQAAGEALEEEDAEVVGEEAETEDQGAEHASQETEEARGAAEEAGGEAVPAVAQKAVPEAAREAVPEVAQEVEGKLDVEMLKREAEAKGLGRMYAAFGGGREGLEACAASTIPRSPWVPAHVPMPVVEDVTISLLRSLYGDLLVLISLHCRGECEFCRLFIFGSTSSCPCWKV